MKAANRSDAKNTIQNMFREGAYNQEVNNANSMTAAKNAYDIAIQKANLMPQTTDAEIQAYTAVKQEALNEYQRLQQRFSISTGVDLSIFDNGTKYGEEETAKVPAAPIPRTLSGNEDIIGMVTSGLGLFNPTGNQINSNYA